ncbi:DUF1294 domain-containing protein [Vibrio breoganii]|uniref:DUF1294 domain-containing protein n=1 Tax=Vibrio breoganii TaxID=553239 RepID=UPI000C8679A7|nr:DUF1294 domain-containing protein [Vibrio breoganii]PML85180.1 hypothetical protein BCT68_07545 [Vibrio breoganii]
MEGQIVEWNDSKGYGFISALNGELKVFIHVTSLKRSNRRPQLNDKVKFDVLEDDKGRVNANNAVILNAYGFPLTVLFGMTFLVTACASIVVFDGELILIPLYLILSIFTYLMFAWDKQAAQNKSWRTRENTLHMLSLAGGWPGALFAQFHLRHKSRKQPFKFILWVTVFMNITGFVWLFTSSGKLAVEYLLSIL